MLRPTRELMLSICVHVGLVYMIECIFVCLKKDDFDERRRRFSLSYDIGLKTCFLCRIFIFYVLSIVASLANPRTDSRSAAEQFTYKYNAYCICSVYSGKTESRDDRNV